MLPNGPKCETLGKKSVEQSECLNVAKSQGYSANHVQTVTVPHAPYGCFAGHPNDNWAHLFFNTEPSGQTGKPQYRTFCYDSGRMVKEY